jgi:transposase
MSPNTSNIMPKNKPAVYVGLDIAKATLQLHLPDRQLPLPNTAAGHARLVELVRSICEAQVICEATGGYERALVAALHAANVPVSVVNPAQVRHFALAQGQRAKNDPIDAALLTAYGQALCPAATPAPQSALSELRDLVQWRDHLKEQLTRARQVAEHAMRPFIGRQQVKEVAHLKKQMSAVEKEIAAALARAPQQKAQVEQLAKLDGVGTLTAVTVLSQMPELGRINRGQTAALAGLAPWTRQSGPWEGQRHIGGGRARVRRALYMSAVALARQTQTILGKFYARLRSAGKPAKVALTAVMRKLLIQMNLTLKNHALHSS